PMTGRGLGKIARVWGQRNGNPKLLSDNRLPATQSTQPFQRIERAGPLGRWGYGEEVADVEQDLQHELVSHVCIVELDHPGREALSAGALVGFAIDRFQILENPG